MFILWCTRCNSMWCKVCQWLAACLWFSPGTPVSSINKTDRHEITEILLRGVLNTITLTLSVTSYFYLVICHSPNIIWQQTIHYILNPKRDGKNCRKIAIIKLDLDTTTIHLLTIPTFTLTFCSWVSIWKPKI
jgi:hypothetical protein